MIKNIENFSISTKSKTLVGKRKSKTGARKLLDTIPVSQFINGLSSYVNSLEPAAQVEFFKQLAAEPVKVLCTKFGVPDLRDDEQVLSLVSTLALQAVPEQYRPLVATYMSANADAIGDRAKAFLAIIKDLVQKQVLVGKDGE